MKVTRQADPVAERMLDIAVSRIQGEGMRVGLDSVRMEEVIKEAGVSRATAYRRWPTRDAFVADVLVATVRRTSLIPETPQDVERLRAVAAAHLPRLGDAQGRRDLVVEALRVSVDADVRRIAASPQWRTFMALSASFPGLPEGGVREAVGRALRETEREFEHRRADVYRNLTALVGYRVIESGHDTDGYAELALAAGSLMTGIVVRAIPNPGWLDERTPLRLFGASQPAPWSEPERLAVGLLLRHVEPDPAVPWSEGQVELMMRRFEEQAVAMLATRPAVAD